MSIKLGPWKTDNNVAAWLSAGDKSWDNLLKFTNLNFLLKSLSRSRDSGCWPVAAAG